MKSLLASLALLLCPVAHATTWQLPTVYTITGHSCGQQVVTSDTPVLSADGTQYTGRVFASTTCSAGGRGAGNSYDTGCASVVWTLDGQMISYEVDWRTTGRYLPAASVCFGS